MTIEAKILADSIGPTGKRLTTMEWTYPRSIHSEIMTHRMLSKNSASSRAIPTDKLIKRVLEDPFIPKYIGKNQRGMQAGEELSEDDKVLAQSLWLDARDHAVSTARKLNEMGIHKQVVNRIIEPWMHITIIVSATEWDNVWGLRCHEAAEPHFQELAYKARDAMSESIPRVLRAGEWHLPLTTVEDELSPEDMIKVSVGRCARVSYLTHDGRRDLQEDIALHDRLLVQRPLHASPAEHVAQAMGWPDWWHETLIEWGSSADHLRDRDVPWLERQYSKLLQAGADKMDPDTDAYNEFRLLRELFHDLQSGNFYGWRQYRKTLEHENIGRRMP